VFVSRRSGSSEIWVCGSDGSNALRMGTGLFLTRMRKDNSRSI
jgi:hypothetical protein